MRADLKIIHRPEHPERLRLPEPETRVCAWNDYSADGFPLRPRPVFGPMGTAALVLCFAATVGISLALYLDGTPVGAVACWLGSALVVVALCLLGWEGRVSSRRQTAEPDDRVALTLKAGAMPYGNDIGQIAFEMGWLIFDGDRCSFAIAVKDVLEVSPDLQNVNLRMVSGDAALTISLQPVSESTAALERLALEVKRWRWYADAVAGVSLYPPLTFNGKQSSSPVQLFPVLVGFAVAIGTVILLIQWIRNGDWLHALGLVTCVALFSGFATVMARSHRSSMAKLQALAQRLTPKAPSRPDAH